MRKIVENSCGHLLKSKKKELLQTNEFSVLYVHKGKLILRPSLEKLEMSQSHLQNEYRVIFMV